MKVNMMLPIRAVMSEWRQARSDSDTALRPKMASIDAMRQAEADLADSARRRGEELAGIEKKLEAKDEYVRRRDGKETAYTRWKDLQDVHAGRAATVFGCTPWYVALIACIGGAKWFINYDVLLQFAAWTG